MYNNDISEPPQRISKLRSMSDLLHAMNRIHRETRQGNMSNQDMGRCANFYKPFANMLKDGELEERLNKLEEHLTLRVGASGVKHDYVNH